MGYKNILSLRPFYLSIQELKEWLDDQVSEGKTHLDLNISWREGEIEDIRMMAFEKRLLLVPEPQLRIKHSFPTPVRPFTQKMKGQMLFMDIRGYVFLYHAETKSFIFKYQVTTDI